EILGSDPGTAKSYVHLDDVVTGIRAGERGASGPFSGYNLGSEDAITVRTIADAICQELGLDGVEYAWTGGAGGGRGGTGAVRTMQRARDRLKRAGWRPGRPSEPAVAAGARDAGASIPGEAARARTTSLTA